MAPPSEHFKDLFPGPPSLLCVLALQTSLMLAEEKHNEEDKYYSDQMSLIGNVTECYHGGSLLHPGFLFYTLFSRQVDLGNIFVGNSQKGMLNMYVINDIYMKKSDILGYQITKTHLCEH